MKRYSPRRRLRHPVISDYEGGIEADDGIFIADESLGIDWQIPTDKALLSEKDTRHSLLEDFDSPFDINMDLYADKILTCYKKEA